MTTFNENPYPSEDNITGSVCSLSLSDGAQDIKVANLTEMVEVQPTYCLLYENSSVDIIHYTVDILTLQCLAVVVEKDRKTKINTQLDKT